MSPLGTEGCCYPQMGISSLSSPLLTRAPALLATPGRQRLAVVAGAAAFFSLFFIGVEVVLPLWATGAELRLSNTEWAHLRMTRMIGIFVGVILLGPLSDRFGQRVVGALAMLGVSGLLVALCFGPPATIWYATPVFGALVSTAFVNMNTLTQGVSSRRQGVANTVYRGIGAAAAVAAPFLVTSLAAQWGGYRPVFLALAGTLVVAAAILWFYPGEDTPPPLRGLGAEVRRMGAGYLTALREAPLLKVIAVTQVWNAALTAVGAFAAIRFTRELGQTEQWFGALGSLGGLVTLAGLLGAGFFLDRVSLRKMHGCTGLLCAAGVVAMGLGEGLGAAVAGFLAFGLLSSVLVGPTSMWVSRAAGAGTQTAAFTLHKLSTAAVLAVAMWLLGMLEGMIGIRLLFLYSGLAGAAISLLFFALPEPPRPGARKAGPVERPRIETMEEGG